MFAPLISFWDFFSVVFVFYAYKVDFIYAVYANMLKGDLL